MGKIPRDPSRSRHVAGVAIAGVAAGWPGGAAHSPAAAPATPSSRLAIRWQPVAGLNVMIGYLMVGLGRDIRTRPLIGMCLLVGGDHALGRSAHALSGRSASCAASSWPGPGELIRLSAGRRAAMAQRSRPLAAAVTILPQVGPLLAGLADVFEILGLKPGSLTLSPRQRAGSRRRDA